MLSKQRAPCRLRLATRSPQGAGLDYPKEDEMVVRRSAIVIVRLVEEDDRRARLLIGIDGKLIATSKLCRLLLGLAALGASKQCRTRICLGELSASTCPPKFFAWLLVQEQIQTYSRSIPLLRTGSDGMFRLCSGSCQDCSDSTRNTATAASRHAAGNTGNT